MGILRVARIAATLVAVAIGASAAGADEASDESFDEADLAALGVDEADDKKLNIFGFIDVNWLDVMTRPSSVWASSFGHEGSFAVGSLNVYVTRELGRGWRTLAELRYTYAPSGAIAPDGSFTNSTTADPANLGRPVQWGGLVLERAYIEYDATSWLTVRAGTFLTPYGIWNVDHGAPAIISLIRPYIIGEQLFPERQTGIELHGERPVGQYTVGYHLTLSNGRGPLTGFKDLDANKGVGGRIELTTHWLGSTKLGVSAYTGRFTDRPASHITVDETGAAATIVPNGTSYDEEAFGADLLVQRGPLHVQSELIFNHRRLRSTPTAAMGLPSAEGGRQIGGYVLAGYRLDRWWNVMPFASVELARPQTGWGGSPVGYTAFNAGLNFRPVPSVVLKMSFSVVDVDSPLYDEHGYINAAQAAWVF
jgi:hypothetical protein